MVNDERDFRRNSEGYSDPTAYAAIKQMEKEKSKLNKLLRTINDICGLAGFEVIGRIALRDKKSGQIWR